MIIFAPLRGPRVFERVVEHVRDAILAGHLRPGDRLPPERELVQQFQVGRGAIREALRILEQSGLIRIRPGNGGGAFVGEQSTAAVTRSLSDLWRFGNIQLEHITEVRLALENLIVDIVVERATRTDLAGLAESVERARRFFDEGKPAERAEENFNFHVLLAEATGNPVYPLLIRSVVDILQPIFIKAGAPERLTRHTLVAHQRIVDHLIARDPAAAKRELRRHSLDVQGLIAKTSGGHQRARRTKSSRAETGLPRQRIHTTAKRS